MSDTAHVKVQVARDEAGFFKQAAQLFLESAAAAVRTRGRFTVSLAGGSTPKKLYSLLSESYYRQRVDWEKTYVLWGDERTVPPTNNDSNYKMAHDALLAKVPISSDHILRIPAEMTSPFEAAKTYEQKLRVLFGKHVPKIDLMLLGLGEDGHTASLFPRTEALNEMDRWTVANTVEALSTTRITLTLPVINNSHRILFLVAGESKAAIVKEILREDLPQNRFPAQLVTPFDGELIWLFDKLAMSKCPDPIRHKAAHL